MDPCLARSKDDWVRSLQHGADQFFSAAQETELGRVPANLGAWHIDFLAGQIHWTSELERIFGRLHAGSRSSIVKFLSYVYWEDRDRCFAALTEQLADISRAHYESEFRIVRGDGRLRRIVLHGEIIRGADKRVHRIVGIATNITKNSSKTERLSSEGDPKAILIINAAGYITAADAQTERLFGYSRKEFVGRSVDMLLPRGVRGNQVFPHTKFSKAFRRRAIEMNDALCARRKDGHEFSVEIGLSPVPEDQDRFIVVFLLTTQRC